MNADHPRCEILVQLAGRLHRSPSAPSLELWLDTVVEDGVPAEAARTPIDDQETAPLT